MLLRQLQLPPSSPDEMRVLYLSTAEIAPAGSERPVGKNDMADPNTHVIYWDSSRNELAVENMQVQNGRIEDLHNFLENRRVLWLTLCDLDRKEQKETVRMSMSVANYLDKSGMQRYAPILWLVVVLLVLGIGAYFLYKWRLTPPTSLPPTNRAIVLTRRP